HGRRLIRRVDDCHAVARHQFVSAADPPERHHVSHRARIGADCVAQIREAPRMNASTLVVVPTYNERANLPVLVAGLMQHPNVRVLVVDDQSPDGTGTVADSLASEYAGRVSVLHRTG